MADANLKCARCNIRGPASSFYWVRGMGWCCAQHPDEAHPNVLKEWFKWARDRVRGAYRISPRTSLERKVWDDLLEEEKSAAAEEEQRCACGEERDWLPIPNIDYGQFFCRRCDEMHPEYSGPEDD